MRHQATFFKTELSARHSAYTKRLISNLYVITETWNDDMRGVDVNVLRHHFFFFFFFFFLNDEVNYGTPSVNIQIFMKNFPHRGSRIYFTPDLGVHLLE